jgi:hypothetical protein
VEPQKQGICLSTMYTYSLLFPCRLVRSSHFIWISSPNLHRRTSPDENPNLSSIAVPSTEFQNPFPTPQLARPPGSYLASIIWTASLNCVPLRIGIQIPSSFLFPCRLVRSSHFIWISSPNLHRRTSPDENPNLKKKEFVFLTTTRANCPGV